MSRAARQRPRRPGPAGEPGPLIDRELSWLEFNDRVLQQALDGEVPLLERLRFASIVSSNLDEFFMVRVGRLVQQVRSDPDACCAEGLTAADQLARIAERTKGLVAAQYRCFERQLLPALARHGVQRVRPELAGPEEREFLERFFLEELFPALTPVRADEPLALSSLSNLTIYVAVRLGRRAGAERRLALIALPRGAPRWVRMPSPRGYRFALVEDLVRRFAPRFFHGHEVLETAVLRLTRNADFALGHDEEADDLLEAVEGAVRARSEGVAARLELERGASPGLGRELCAAIGVDAPRQLYVVDGPLDLRPFAKLGAHLEGPGLRYPRFDPQPSPALYGARSPWEAVRERDVLLHVPYESFSHVVELLQAAAEDPDVLAIKQTLYRTSDASPIVDALEKAARRGKQVTALVELRARFDEARNIGWARRLTEAGAQVIHGVVGLKTHAKLLVIVRREPDAVRRYVHLSTGNYNPSTACAYEDLGLLTCDPDFGADASNFFNAVTGFSEPRDWRQFAVAPAGLRDRLNQLIAREVARSTPEAPGAIDLKMNSLVDAELSGRLLDAARAGVRVRLCVRGVCALRPQRGVPLEVVSIVDRFLEHSRILYFRNGGQEELYLSSADFMPRNLDRRLELLFPVRDAAACQRLKAVLATLFEDNRHAWRLGPGGGYERVAPRRGEPPRSAQETFIREALARGEAARAAAASIFRPQGPGRAGAGAG